VPGEELRHNGVTVWGGRDVPSSMPVHASQLYSRNVVNLLLLMTADGAVEPDFGDEILAATCVTRGDR
jgi:NAD(P) transhydrogenase subunit alpha